MYSTYQFVYGVLYIFCQLQCPEKATNTNDQQNKYFASNDSHRVWGTWGLSCHRRIGRRKGRMEEGMGRLIWDIWDSGA